MRASITIHKVTNEAVFIIDNDQGVSVTNDAENVVPYLLGRFFGAHLRIIYRDTTGQWDELLHDGTSFTGFAPTELRP